MIYFLGYAPIVKGCRAIYIYLCKIYCFNLDVFAFNLHKQHCIINLTLIVYSLLTMSLRSFNIITVCCFLELHNIPRQATTSFYKSFVLETNIEHTPYSHHYKQCHDELILLREISQGIIIQEWDHYFIKNTNI